MLFWDQRISSKCVYTNGNKNIFHFIVAILTVLINDESNDYIFLGGRWGFNAKVTCHAWIFINLFKRIFEYLIFEQRFKRVDFTPFIMNVVKAATTFQGFFLPN